MGGQQITDLDRRGRKPKEESHAEESHEELAAWRQMPESSRPSLRKLADQLGTSEQLLSHYLKTQDEWDANRQAAKCQASGDARGWLYWWRRAALCELVRKIERRWSVAGSDAGRRLSRGLKRIEAKFRREERETDLKSLKMFASAGIPRAQEVLAKLNKKK